MKPIYKVAVIGGGTMGLDIAALMIRQGMPVVLKEVSEELALGAQTKFGKRVDGWLDKNKISASDAERMKMCFAVTAGYSELSDVDLVIEAVPENLEIKQGIFEELDRNLPGDVIFTSNTSSLPIKLLSARLSKPERMAGVHFFNPPTKMPLVELIPSAVTAGSVIESLDMFVRETLGKVAIRVKDRPGFLVNVLLGAYLTPAVRALEYSIINMEEVDAEAQSFGLPMGPFTLMDMLGIDVVKEVTQILFSAYGDKFTPSGLVQAMVDKGRLGQKSGVGFYGRPEELEEILRGFQRSGNVSPQKVFTDMMNSMINEAALALQDDIATANDIETGCRFGLGFPQNKEGPLHYADMIGTSIIIDSLGEKACELLKNKAREGSTFFESL